MGTMNYPPPPHFDVPDDIGGYYERCRLQQKYWHEHLVRAIENNAPPEEIRWLEERRLRAGDTGD